MRFCSRAGAQVQRGHRLALLLAAEHGRQEQGLYDLAAEYVARFPDDVVDSRTVFFALGDQRGVPHWFMAGATTGWRGLYQDASAAERLAGTDRNPELFLSDLTRSSSWHQRPENRDDDGRGNPQQHVHWQADPDKVDKAVATGLVDVGVLASPAV